MLKKAGTVAASAAAGLFIMSPLALADEANGVNVGQDNNIAVPVQACGDQVAAVLAGVVPVLSASQTACTLSTGLAHNDAQGKRGEPGREGNEYNGINVLNGNNVAVPVQACGDQVSILGLVVPVGSPSNSACSSEIFIKQGGGPEEYNGINLINENNIVVPVQACGDQVAVLGAVVPILSPMATACSAAISAIER